MILVRLADTIVLSWGWKRRLIALIAGALAALSMAPFGAFPVLILSFPVLILLIDGARAARNRGARLRAAFGAGWWFGFGYFLCSLWWIGSAFLVEASTFGWLLPVAVAGLPAGLAFFTGAGTALAYALWARGPYRVLSFALGLMAAEYARSVLFTGFPWNLFGEALTQWLWLAQSASLVGVMGLTFVALVVFASPVALCEANARALTRIGPVMASLSLLLIMAVFGAWRVETTPIKQVEGPRLRLIQPGIPQDERFRSSSKDWIMERYETLSTKATSQDRKSLADVTHLFWPESSFPFFLIYDPEALGRIARMLPAGTTLITGAVRPDMPKGGGTRPDVYNSAYALNNKGEILATTDKFHLVPFGEYLPFQAALEAMGLQQITRMRGGFSAGAGPQLTRLPGLPPFVTLICYEIIFPRVTASLDSRPSWILNLTNDAWFGTTPGPYQHAHKAVIRAIEEGLPVVRVANNGISMVVGPTGRVEASLPLNARNTLDFVLDQPLAATIYARFGDILLLLVALLSLKVVWSRKLHPFD